MFLEAQGHKITKSFLEQDNESTIKLEQNGRASVGPRSRHINIRYFWIMDRTKETGIPICHCPTERMLGDFFRKPFKADFFRKLRSHHIMSMLHNSRPFPQPRSVLEKDDLTDGNSNRMHSLLKKKYRLLKSWRGHRWSCEAAHRPREIKEFCVQIWACAHSLKTIQVIKQSLIDFLLLFASQTSLVIIAYGYGAYGTVLRE